MDKAELLAYSLLKNVATVLPGLQKYLPDGNHELAETAAVIVRHADRIIRRSYPLP